MDIDKMREWIQQGDICRFLEDPVPVKNEWVKVYEYYDTLYEHICLVPLLLGKRQAKRALVDTPGWNREYNCPSRPRLVLPGKSHFLSKKLRGYYPGIRFYGSTYKCDTLGEVAKREIFLPDKEIIHLRRDILATFLQQERKRLLLGVDSFRFSERTLEELGLDDNRWDKSGNGFRYSLFLGCYSDSAFRDKMSTITHVLGKKVVWFEGQ